MAQTIAFGRLRLPGNRQATPIRDTPSGTLESVPGYRCGDDDFYDDGGGFDSGDGGDGADDGLDVDGQDEEQDDQDQFEDDQDAGGEGDGGAVWGEGGNVGGFQFSLGDEFAERGSRGFADWAESMRNADTLMTALNDEEVSEGLRRLRAEPGRVARTEVSLVVFKKG